MSRRFLLVGSVFAGAFLSAPTVAHAGEQLGVTWTDCVVAPSDADRDGLDDDCELAVTAGFEPELVFGVDETATDRIPFWAARPDGDETLRIFYALSYLVDAGDPTFGGASGHNGDSEFIVLRVHYDGGGTWSLIEGYLSAHYGTFCDAGDWFPAVDFQYVNQPLGRPLVFSAEGKHANYTDLDRCDAGGCYQDSCNDNTRESFGVEAGRDLGLYSTQLVDEVVVSGNSEWFWTDIVFCGWQLAPADDRSSGCVPVENSYARELTAFEMDYGPVTADSSLCEPCAGDGDCLDGGICLGGACGRACEGSCPVHSHCEGPGVGQCVPDGPDCSCFLACQDRACGDDGCGGTCGTCPSGSSCDQAGQCQPDNPQCVPDCNGLECGDDGCGGVCGDCLDGETCDPSGQCVATNGAGGGGGASDGADGGDGTDGGCSCSVEVSGSGQAGALLLAGFSLLLSSRRRRRLAR
ncbi:MAG: MYXO-CTERM sorting domain-containing protein [Polyangiaceae bacterium]